ncbi:centrosomal protein of 89 kDa-like isoform X2 [Zootermopsis nevadensis]|nr:centrosomal protein of 89 kDa-like isoform X2 [Zootermopsis nevadensis]XP_021923238.1 centrosomal protein of 89 kDa-like isoform X2 [Zootermopsis nevadensis]XP_021923239.1 centrosomal protein of 89 kDa-like isoform X2 [Zootermopsis nevadensis]XP_021923240.1 centrosomal protein of 89 kDa-like isoform X2 [Zootermopsis nevadensis]XP_021923241.1 centrosomal protein of 89 kDa-like isoform X2 [Zootermopsis nevadensis]
MPPPLFSTVPSLPMFVVESRRNRLTSQSEKPEQLSVQSTSDVIAGGTELETQWRHHRKRSKQRSQLVDKQVGDGSSSKDNVSVHPRRRHHHRHKYHRGSSVQATKREELTCEGEPSQSQVSENPMEQPPKPKPRRKLRLTDVEHRRSRSVSRATLLQESDGLTKENKELSTNLQQLSHSSQDSGYQQTTVNENLCKKEDVEILKVKLVKLESNNKHLKEERDAFKTELEHMKSQEKNELEQTAALQVQNQELNEDTTLLKNLVYRLNVELDRYQQKLHRHGGTGELPPLKVMPSEVQEKETSMAWRNVNKNLLGSLLEAYQETINEKDDLIHVYEQDLNKFVAKCKQIVAENEKLYQDLEEANRQVEERSSSWHTLQQDASQAQEQNELLTNELQLQKEKLDQIQAECDGRVAELTKDNEMLVNKFHQYRGDLLTLKGQYSVLREEYDRLKKDADSKVPFAIHSASVSECRRLLDELKTKYEGDKSNLTSQVQELQSQKPHLEVQLVNVTTENKKLQVQVKTLDKLLKKMQHRCEELQSRLVTCQVSRDASKRQLQKAMTFSEELVAEQENLLRQLHAKQEENNSIARLGTTIVYRMGSLKTKLKTVQKDAWAELDVVEKRIHQQETDVERMKDEYHREVMRLRNLLKQKEMIIGRLQQEKTKTQEDLEVVWRAATSEDLRIKEKLKQANLLSERESDFFLNHARTYS